MAGIPKAKAAGSKRIDPSNLDKINRCDAVLFSFESIDRNDYFNLDGTCQNWAADLFDAMRKVSALSMADIRAGKYSGKQSPFRIHKHNNASPPCRVPDSISLDNMWQIRISRSKGGIHGIFVDNVFYVVWFDPHHNLYPDENHGGLKRIVPPSTCCKDRDEELKQLQQELAEIKEQAEFWEAEALAREKSHLSNQ